MVVPNSFVVSIDGVVQTQANALIPSTLLFASIAGREKALIAALNARNGRRAVMNAWMKNVRTAACGENLIWNVIQHVRFH